MISNGTYKAKATGEVVLGKAANENRTPFIEFYFVIVDGENKGGQIRWTSYLSEKTAARTIESLQYCGWEGDDLSEFLDGELHGLDANEVAIVVELEEYEKEGEKKVAPRVRWVNKVGGYLNVKNKMSSADANAFGAEMRGLVLKMKAKNPPKDASFDFGANVPQSASGGRPKGW